jgi:hypothetical protein
MSNILIAQPFVPTAIASATATEASWPASKVGTVQPRDAAVFTASPAQIDLDLGTALAVGVVALVSTTATSWTVRAASDQASLGTAAAIVDDAIVHPGIPVGALLFDGVVRSYRWWRVELVGTAPIGVGRILIGAGWQPTWNIEFGSVRGFGPGLEFDSSVAGALYPMRRSQRRRWSLPFGDITDDEYSDVLEALDRHAAGGGEVLVVRSPGESDPLRLQESIYGLLSTPQGFTRRRQNRWRALMTIEEML